MTQESIMALKAAKCANIIKAMNELSNLSLKEATDVYYQTETAGMIEDGVADLQCRSNKYLALLILEEYQNKQGTKHISINQ